MRNIDLGYNKKNIRKIGNFKIKNKTLLSQQEKSIKNINQTLSTIIPNNNSRAQTSSTNNRRRKFVMESDYMGNYISNNYLDYDVLFNKTDRTQADFCFLK